MEAKFYALNNGVGVKEVLRLISRLRNRQFGVLVTTYYVAPRAHMELKEDEHPVVIISAVDTTKLLLKKFNSFKKIQEWLIQYC